MFSCNSVYKGVQYVLYSQPETSFIIWRQRETERKRERERERERRKSGRTVLQVYYSVWRKSPNFLASLTCLDVNAACGYRSNSRYKNINFGVTTETRTLISE